MAQSKDASQARMSSRKHPAIGAPDSNVFYSYVAAGVTRGSTVVDRSRMRPGKDPSVKQLRFEYIATMGIISAVIIGLMVGAIAKHATGLNLVVNRCLSVSCGDLATGR